MHFDIIVLKLIREKAPPRGSDKTTIAPTQQVSVPVTSQSAAKTDPELLKRIDALLQQLASKKKPSKKGFAQAKKQYKAWRKKAVTAAKSETKQIKKRQLARIRRLPAAQRPKAREQLKTQLKEREAALKKRYPAKVSNIEELRRIMKR